MSSAKIILIRHAEEPDPTSAEPADDPAGAQDPDGLSVRGWQRARALVRWFSPLDEQFANPRLARPSAIFAAASSARHPSHRPVQTVTPLAESLGLRVDDRYASDQPSAGLIATLMAVAGPVLVCWRHDTLPALARALMPGVAVPQRWPADRYDVAWVLDLNDGRCRLDQVPQRLLAGDHVDPIR